MAKGALTKRLQKTPKKKTILVSIRFEREDLETLDKIEDVANVRYDWLLKMLLKRFLLLWNRQKRIELPLYIISKDEAIKLGIAEEDGLELEPPAGPKGKGKIKWLQTQKE